MFAGPAQAEAADHLRHAQRRDRHGSRQGPRRHAVRHRNGAAIPPRRLTIGPDPGTDPQYRPRERPHACRRALQKYVGMEIEGKTLGVDRPRQARHQGRRSIGAGASA